MVSTFPGEVVERHDKLFAQGYLVSKSGKDYSSL